MRRLPGTESNVVLNEEPLPKTDARVRRILQIVPRLPPSTCGVGDYAHLVARELEAAFGIQTRFMVADPAWNSPAADIGLPFQVFESRHPSHAADQIIRAGADCEAVLVQYSGYGFSKRGTPLWLLAAMKRFRTARPKMPIVVMFHELYATGPVYRSSFWLSLAQRHVTRSLAALADHVHVNRFASARWLESAVPALRGRVIVKQVFSNLGELRNPTPPSQRERRLVLFGHQFRDGPEFWKRLERIAHDLRATNLIILTRPLQPPAGWPVELPVESHGILDASAVSAILEKARWGCLSYPPAFLGKSGVLAALLAHGVVPVLYDDAEELSEGLRLREHMLTSSALELAANETQLDRVSENATAWYRTHDIATTAACYASHLREETATPAP